MGFLHTLLSTPDLHPSLPACQMASRPPCFPKFLCSSCHLPLGVPISLLTPSLSCGIYQDWLTSWLHLCLSVDEHQATGQMLTFFPGLAVWRKESGYGSSATETHRSFICLFCFYLLVYFSNMPGHIKTMMISLH